MSTNRSSTNFSANKQSHYQLLDGDPVPSSPSCCYRLFHSYTPNQMRKWTKIKPTVWNFSGQRQLDQFPKTLGFVPGKKKKREGKDGWGAVVRRKRDCFTQQHPGLKSF